MSNHNKTSLAPWLAIAMGCLWLAVAIFGNRLAIFAFGIVFILAGAAYLVKVRKPRHSRSRDR